MNLVIDRTKASTRVAASSLPGFATALVVMRITALVITVWLLRSGFIAAGFILFWIVEGTNQVRIAQTRTSRKVGNQ